ncbi:MAG: hypothetical protein RR426_08425, partial [Oscillospiraceae bacterium]
GKDAILHGVRAFVRQSSCVFPFFHPISTDFIFILSHFLVIVNVESQDTCDFMLDITRFL